MAITVIHGPMATGKTVHANAFAAHFGAKRIFGDLILHGRQDPRDHDRYFPSDGDLVLTTDAPERLYPYLPGATFVPINDARHAIGLEPAPNEGFIAAERRRAGTGDLVDRIARALARAHHLNFDEVCGFEVEGGDDCDSDTCVAAHYEDHDAGWARDDYRRQARAAIAVIQSEDA